MIRWLKEYSGRKVSIAPLVIFRIAFGALMFFSVLRFIFKGWVKSMYVTPKIYFPYFGFEWISPLPETGMYLVFALLLISSACMMAGLLYRYSACIFFMLFTYVELIDKTNYLNHYYFVSLVSFLMILAPAGNAFSLDNKFFRRPETVTIPRLYILMFQLQMFVVYFFAGVAKVNYDWLIEAQPLRTWLPAYSHYPLIGGFMEQAWLAYIFSWFGCIYDLAIGFLLFGRRTVNIAYVFVVIFHLATSLFFNIGMFPFIMITITIIFFREEFHLKIMKLLQMLFRYRDFPIYDRPAVTGNYIPAILLVYFVVQFVMPLRFAFYSGKLFWTEQGYRFSWRVMLMEKAGVAFFTVTDSATGRKTEVDNKEYLTYMQEKMMATQPDMMVDYAKFLKNEFIEKGFTDPVVTVQSWVTLNGSGSREFIDPATDLSSKNNSFLAGRDWVRSY